MALVENPADPMRTACMEEGLADRPFLANRPVPRRAALFSARYGERSGSGGVRLFTPPDTTTRRFPAPWRAVSTLGGWCVEDATGMRLAYVYGDDRPEGVNERKLTCDKARRIAAGIARIPDRQGRSWPGHRSVTSTRWHPGYSGSIRQAGASTVVRQQHHRSATADRRHRRAAEQAAAQREGRAGETSAGCEGNHICRAALGHVEQRARQRTASAPGRGG